MEELYNGFNNGKDDSDGIGGKPPVECIRQDERDTCGNCKPNPVWSVEYISEDACYNIEKNGQVQLAVGDNPTAIYIVKELNRQAKRIAELEGERDGFIEKLFEKIKHGDQEHQNWLWNEMQSFTNHTT
jgi:hypothetical protein